MIIRSMFAATVCLVLLGLVLSLSRWVETQQLSGMALAAVPTGGNMLEPVEKPAKDFDVSSLSCFRCHNFEHYENGKDYSHSAQDKGGHCNNCHAFQGHFESIIRKHDCEECP